jgi:transcriptional regulator with XRE-family HTH domain
MHRSTVITCFAASVRKLRSGLGISQEELAERADLHRTYIADIERGARNPTLLTIKKLAKGLGVSAADLLSEAKCNGC